MDDIKKENADLTIVVSTVQLMLLDGNARWCGAACSMIDVGDTDKHVSLLC